MMLGQDELCIEMEYSRLQYLMEDSAHQESEADIYKRIRVLGCGSYGRAFLVQDKQFGEEWAIKQISLGDMAPEEQEAALKEAKILQMLNHPNIVRFREVYRTAKMKLNIVMQYAAGGDLAHRIKAAKESKIHFSERQILDWFVQICLALRYIHSNKIIHRDLKAQNVFLTSAGIIKLGDFGVAKVLEHSAARARTVVGSPYYFSPELIENRPYSFKTDIWSLGALLYELCALQPPFQANNLQFLALKIVQGAPPPLPKMYSEGLRSLVRFMLQTKESNRPTIHQIFSERIILDTIKRLNEGRQPQPNQISQTVSDFSRLGTLKPPPNLLGLDPQENKSDIVLVKNQRKDEEDVCSINKSKTPQVVVKKGPNNFFQRPMTGRKRADSNSADVDLAGLMQIKPSLLEKHEKHQKPQIPLPPVPKSSPSSKIVSGSKPPFISHPQSIQQLPSSAFIKKKASYPHIESESKSNQKKEQSQQEIKPISIKPLAKKVGLKVGKNEKELKKPQIRRKTLGGAAGFKQEAGQIKLEVCSEQIKKRQFLQKKAEKKKPEKAVKKSQKNKKQKKVANRQAEQQEVMQEQKFNSDQELQSNNETEEDYCSSYYDQEFESYSEESEEDVDLAFSVTNEGANINFQQILAELGRIQKIVQTGEDIEKAQELGESIPELIDFSSEVREDDSQLDSNHSICLTNNQAVKQYEAKYAGNGTQSNEDTQVEQIDLGCLSTHAQLEIVRMKLQDIFGVDNIIFAYKVMEEFLFKDGLNFSEKEVIALILAQRPCIDQKALRKYFGHIAAIITKENNLI